MTQFESHFAMADILGKTGLFTDTYNIAIWSPAYYVPFDSDLSIWINIIIGFCKYIKKKTRTSIIFNFHDSQNSN